MFIIMISLCKCRGNHSIYFFIEMVPTLNSTCFAVADSKYGKVEIFSSKPYRIGCTHMVVFPALCMGEMHALLVMKHFLDFVR